MDIARVATGTSRRIQRGEKKRMSLPPNGLKGWRAGAPPRRDDGALAIVELVSTARVDGQEHYGQPIIVARWNAKLKTTAAGHRIEYDDVLQHIELGVDHQGRGTPSVAVDMTASDRHARKCIEARNDELLVVPTDQLTPKEGERFATEDVRDFGKIGDMTERYLAGLSMAHSARSQLHYRKALEAAAPALLAFAEQVAKAEDQRRESKRRQVESGSETPLTVGEALASAESSTWVKAALLTAIERDPVDAANDADVLASVLDTRAHAHFAAARTAAMRNEDS
ncbi:hypothetical protein [Piscinibacter gummiphilus]|uniref:DUF2213 domain-containing protein n=1 Tax=Piscinibacter gummiphilus TaxID=946333 RepID=A0ABZ0D241_9BURK|nr:hypothetical protein [Piscinibacter gummiphilus]WOB11304.1 hypothetical protein RXV79_27035 [Piscinibacter gummiphilus]